MIARKVHYTGRVQGVGFRYTVKQTAQGYEVVGWVRNLIDGRVEMVAQSYDVEELDEFLEGIRESAVGGGIKEEEIEEIDPPEGLVGFSIR